MPFEPPVASAVVNRFRSSHVVFLTDSSPTPQLVATTGPNAGVSVKGIGEASYHARATADLNAVSGGITTMHFNESRPYSFSSILTSLSSLSKKRDHDSVTRSPNRSKDGALHVSISTY